MRYCIFHIKYLFQHYFIITNLSSILELETKILIFFKEYRKLIIISILSACYRNHYNNRFWNCLKGLLIIFHNILSNFRVDNWSTDYEFYAPQGPTQLYTFRRGYSLFIVYILYFTNLTFYLYNAHNALCRACPVWRPAQFSIETLDSNESLNPWTFTLRKTFLPQWITTMIIWFQSMNFTSGSRNDPVWM